MIYPILGLKMMYPIFNFEFPIYQKINFQFLILIFVYIKKIYFKFLILIFGFKLYIQILIPILAINEFPNFYFV